MKGQKFLAYRELLAREAIANLPESGSEPKWNSDL